MIELRYAWRWQVAGILLLAMVLTAALLPETPLTDLAAMLIRSDKAMHVIAFTVLAIWFSGQYEKRSYWRIAAGLIAFGVLIELIQGTLSYRTSEWLDLAGDALGIALGLAIGALGAGGWSLQVEEWLGS